MNDRPDTRSQTSSNSTKREQDIFKELQITALSKEMFFYLCRIKFFRNPSPREKGDHHSVKFSLARDGTAFLNPGDIKDHEESQKM